MQIWPLNLGFVILFLYNSKLAYRRINAWFSRRTNRNHDRESFRTYNKENEKLQKMFKKQSLKSNLALQISQHASWDMFGTFIKIGTSDK